MMNRQEQQKRKASDQSTSSTFGPVWACCCCLCPNCASPGAPAPWYILLISGLAILSSSFCLASYSAISALGLAEIQLSTSLILFSNELFSLSSILPWVAESLRVCFRLAAYPSRAFLAYTLRLIFSSCSLYFSASLTNRSISSLERRPLLLVMVILALRLVPLSLASTFIIPLASISKLTSIWGTPLGAGGIPLRLNCPRRLLSLLIWRSPSNTWISTPGWLSLQVVKICDFLVGMVVFLGMRTVITPPAVSIPRERGATSSRMQLLICSEVSPWRMAACTAAPQATASSGLIDRLGYFPLKYSLRSSITLGILVEPPTSTTSWIWPFDIPESFSTFSTGGMVSLNWARQSSSNLARVRVREQSYDSARESTSMVVWAEELRILLAFSHWVLSLLRALAFLRMSIPFLRRKSAAQQSTILLSKSSPPRWVSPAVALTSKTPSSMLSRETSKVPPPRSKMRMFFSPLPFLSSPQAMAAAVGSLMILRTLRPAMEPASLVACLWLSLKQAGTVMTAFLTVSPRQVSAVSFILVSTMEEISSGKNFLASPLCCTTITGLPSLLPSTLNGQCCMSFCTT